MTFFSPSFFVLPVSLRRFSKPAQDTAFKRKFVCTSLGLALVLTSCGAPSAQDENSNPQPAASLTATYEIRAEEGRDIVAQASFRSTASPDRPGQALLLEGENTVKLNSTPLRLAEDPSECLAAVTVCYLSRQPANDQNLAQNFVFEFGNSPANRKLQTAKLPLPVQLKYAGTPLANGTAPSIVLNLNQPVGASWDPFTPEPGEKLFLVFQSGKSNTRVEILAAEAPVGFLTIAPEKLKTLDASALGGFLQFERKQTQGSVNITVLSQELPTDFVRTAN